MSELGSSQKNRALVEINLYEKLTQNVNQWRTQGYSCPDYPAIGEILQWAREPDGEGFRLCLPQIHALETHWYLRLCEGTPHTIQLYRKMFPFITNLLVLYGSRIREYYADFGSVQLGNKPPQLATALYKLVYGNARFKDKQELKRVEGVKAFFVNDPSQVWNELRGLSQLDWDKSGTIDQNELLVIRQMKVRLTFSDRLIEFSTIHHNMLKRIKRLSTYAVQATDFAN